MIAINATPANMSQHFQTANADLEAELIANPDLQTLHKDLRALRICKICMDKEFSSVFVPCGHLIACNDCAANIMQCPLCRRQITGVILTKMRN